MLLDSFGVGCVCCESKHIDRVSGDTLFPFSMAVSTACPVSLSFLCFASSSCKLPNTRNYGIRVYRGKNRCWSGYWTRCHSNSFSLLRHLCDARPSNYNVVHTPVPGTSQWTSINYAGIWQVCSVMSRKAMNECARTHIRRLDLVSFWWWSVSGVAVMVSLWNAASTRLLSVPNTEQNPRIQMLNGWCPY